MTYTKKNYTLYYAISNYCNYLLLRDIWKDKYLMITWDLTPEEITKIRKKFLKKGLEENDRDETYEYTPEEMEKAFIYYKDIEP